MSTESTLTLDSVVATNPGFMTSEVDGELVMMDVEKGTYYGLDPVASRIWQELAEPTRLGDVCTRLIATYDVEQDRCESEVLAFVADLQRNGLVTVS